MNINDAILNRRSIRKYEKGYFVSDNDIKTMLTAAMHAPSACNTRPWEFLVIKTEEAKERVLKCHTSATFLKDASLAILVCALPERQEGTRGTGFYPQDCGAAIQNILLSAYSLGLGTCWCGIYPKEERVKLFKEEFNLTSLPLGLVVIGKACEEPAAKGFYEEEKVRMI